MQLQHQSSASASTSIRTRSSSSSSRKAMCMCLLYALTFLMLTLEVESMGRLCGNALPEALDKICLNGFNEKFKRSQVKREFNEIDDEADTYGDTGLDYGSNALLERILGLGGLHQLGESSLYQLAKTRRRRFGITDECCRKSCTYGELTAYCKPA